MNEHRLTGSNFDNTIRHDLRFKHGFEHHDLERAKAIMTDAIEHVEKKKDTKQGLAAHHLDAAMSFLNKKHPQWRELSAPKKAHIEEALKAHFGISEEATPE